LSEFGGGILLALARSESNGGAIAALSAIVGSNGISMPINEPFPLA